LHAADCSVSPDAVTRFPGDREGSIRDLSVAADVPPSLRRLLDNEPPAQLICRQRDSIEDGGAHREGMLAQLLFAARDLAEQNILGAGWPAVVDMPAPASWCRECQMTERLDRLQHTNTCRTGRVLRIVDELCSTLDFKPGGKEAATGEKTDRAGDGIRLRGLTERVCLKCGAHGGHWIIAEVPAATFDVSQLGLNQLVGNAWKSDKVTIFTHRCEGGAQ
jgi:hypothetical protein